MLNMVVKTYSRVHVDRICIVGEGIINDEEEVCR